MTHDDHTPNGRTADPTPELLPDHDGDRGRPDTELGEDEGSAVNRRDYLRTVGAVSAAGLLGASAGAGTAGSAAAQSNWEAEADARILEHRTSDLEIVVRDSSGNPIPDAMVEVEMTEHEFRFGTAVNADELLNASDDDPYRQHLRELFNTAVLENHHKWRFFEENQETADRATQWLLDEGFIVRGHACVWGSRDTYAVPADVEQAIDSGDADTIIERSMEHIETIISHYGDDIQEWDVVNEALHAHDLQVGVYGDQIDTDEPWTGEVVPWYSELVGDWYEHARAVADEYGVQIAVNDFNTLNGWDYTTTWYPEHLDYLTDERGIEIDSIGFQGHIEANTGEPFTNESPDERLSYDQINQLLEIYETYDAELKVTEFDTYQGSAWSGDEEKAEVLRTYMKALFAHPNATDFLIWGFWDGNHWGDDAPLFYNDWSPKPAYDVWTGLVFDEWWTDEAGRTDASGAYTATAFLGEHEVTVTTTAGSTTETVTVTDSDGTTTVEITTDGEGDPNLLPSPSGLSASPASTSSIEVSWNAVDGADRYNVYVDGSLDHGTTSTSTALTGLAQDTAYEIGVTAVGGDGTESGASTTTARTRAPVPAWDPDAIYDTGDRVVHDGVVWEAQWWTQGQEPRDEDYYVWQYVRDADDGDNDEPGEGIQLDGYTARDLNGDGRHRDVNGNGTTDFDDIVTFFEHMNSDGVQNNVSAFDFNDNGGIDFDDVVALFESV